MFRKFVIAAALSVSATSAEAGHKHFYHHGWHFKHHWYGGFGPRYVHYYGGCIRRVWVVNRFGETVLRRINVCY
jgi:hypothetical protein